MLYHVTRVGLHCQQWVGGVCKDRGHPVERAAAAGDGHHRRRADQQSANKFEGITPPYEAGDRIWGAQIAHIKGFRTSAVDKFICCLLEKINYSAR